MKIDPGLQRTQAQELKQQSKTDGAKEAGSGKSQGAGGRPLLDTVSISEEARSLQRTQSELTGLKQELESAAQAPVRPDKVEAARARLASGELLSDEVIEKTAESILSSGALSDLVDAGKLKSGARLATGREGGLDPERLAELRQRIESGFYSSPQAVERIAEGMLEDLLA